MNKIKTHTVVRTSVALLSMTAIVIALAAPYITLPSASHADTIVNDNSIINSANNVSNVNVSTNSSGSCGNTCNYPPTTGTCVANASSVKIGDTVSFHVTPAGGVGGYQYDWSGTDGISGHTPTVTKSFSSAGTKTAHVIIYSYGTPGQADCSVTVTNGGGCDNTCNYPPTTGTCVANVSTANIGDTVSFRVTPAGGVGGYQYDWSGTDGIAGHTPVTTQVFNTPGVKTAHVIIYSYGTPGQADCSVTINQPVQPITVICQVNVNSANIGDVITFTATASGGTGGYRYDWSGSDGIYGNSQSMQKVFSTSGSKSANVQVTSGNLTATATCNVTIIIIVNPDLNVVCIASDSSINIGSSVTFTATATGGDRQYSYSWNGTDGLNGSNSTVYKTYTTAGSKSATVTVQSDGKSKTANCNTNVSQPIQPISVVCEASATVINTGSSVTFSATATGGAGSYGYVWNGTDGISGTSQSMTKTFSTSGSKSATVTVYSNGQTATATCNITVNIIVVNQPPTVVCYVNNSSINVGNGVTYTATATGGDGRYTYSWNGSNGINGSNSTAYMTYNNPGSQYATVNVYSNGQNATATCNVTVVQPYVPQNTVSAYCVANPSTINVGQNMTWTVYPIGGNGGYTYSWNGSDGFYGNNGSNNSSVSYAYQTSGTKTMIVTVYSNGQTITANCSGNVQQQYVQPVVTVTQQPPINPSSGVYLSAIPATGISNSMKTSLFVAGMFIWSAFAAYLFLSRRNGKLAMAAMMGAASAVPASTMPEIVPTTMSLSEKISDMARRSNILLSHDALSAIAAQANGDEVTAGSLINSIAAKIGSSENFTTVNMQKLNELTA